MKHSRHEISNLDAPANSVFSIFHARPDNFCEADNGIIRTPSLQAFVRYWDVKRSSLRMPARRHIDPIEIPRLLPIALLSDATASGYRMRLLGTEATAAYGRETRGKLIDDFEFGEFTEEWRKAFRRVTVSMQPVFATGRFRKAKLDCSVATVLLPLSDDGLSVSEIFGGLLIKSSWESE